MITVSPTRLTWLEGELRSWQLDGLVDEATATAIRGRYVASTRFSLASIILGLGASFVGIGMIWLVAANLDQLSPSLRFGLAVLVWLGATAGGEAVAQRLVRDGDRGSPMTGALRVVSVLTFGAVIFQAAQSLQVDAGSWALVGYWAAGAVLFAYVTGSSSALFVAVALATVWFPQGVTPSDQLYGMLAAGALTTAIGAVHAARWRPSSAAPWRLAGVLQSLVVLFVIGLTGEDRGRSWNGPAWIVLALVVTLVVAAAVLTGRRDPVALQETVAGALAMAGGLGLLLWRADGDREHLTPALTGWTACSVLLFLVTAGWIATVGVRRGQPVLTWCATAGLTVFTTVQSFAVFAPIISGATLFLVLGVILLVSGYLFDRARRRLARALPPATETTS